MSKKGSVNDVISQLADTMTSDQKVFNDTFGEFKMQNVPEKKQFNASRVFSNEELEVLRPDYGSVIDRIKSKKR